MASGPTASGRAPSVGLQLAVDGREDPEPDEEVCESEVRRRVERRDASEERLSRQVKAHRDVGIQGTALVVDELERYGVGTVFQVQMQGRVVRQLSVPSGVESHLDMALVRNARGSAGSDEDEVRDAERERRVGTAQRAFAGEVDRKARCAAGGRPGRSYRVSNAAFRGGDA